tara:strand:+ start:3275 stop:3988 length:714 start_codon:yes stop_codon:yes gene_type:complete
MFITTSGIVLRVYPFRDKKSIAKIFTKQYGLISCIITKNKSQIPLSQILTIAEITYKHSKNQNLFYIKDVQIEYIYTSLTVDREKIQIAMVLCEILNKCIYESNAQIYNFILSAFKKLDQSLSCNIGFDTLFLIKFCSIMGISPFDNHVPDIENSVLDIEEGRFVENMTTPNNKLFIPKRESLALYKLSKLNFDQLESSYITNDLNLSLFHYMVLYVSTHLTDLTQLKSIRVMKDLV